MKQSTVEAVNPHCACNYSIMNGITYCPLHAAAPDLLEALEETKGEIAMATELGMLTEGLRNTIVMGCYAADWKNFCPYPNKAAIEQATPNDHHI